MEKKKKNDANKAAVLVKKEKMLLGVIASPENTDLASALKQCDRLKLAITQFHAEGLRFAAYTLLRMTLSAPSPAAAPVQAAAQQLKAALDTAGYPH